MFGGGGAAHVYCVKFFRNLALYNSFFFGGGEMMLTLLSLYTDHKDSLCAVSLEKYVTHTAIEYVQWEITVMFSCIFGSCLIQAAATVRVKHIGKLTDSMFLSP